jgi:energy-coupling factor transporter ATP-binding protein EcfA2/cell division protein FtsB
MTLKLPYPGLRSFEESDGPIFFGREKQIATLLRRLEKHRFVAVVGASGSGKSSLVKAGLLPAVRRGFLAGAARWLPIVIRPGADPYQRLGDELLNFRRTFSATEDFTEKFRKKLRLTDHGLVEALPDLGLDSDTRLLLVIDQFEELFSFRCAVPGSDDHASRDEASAFVTMLLSAFKEKHANIWVLLTMRSDFIGNCEAFLGLPENVSQSQFLVPRLDAWQMEEAIVRPGLVTGAAFEPFTVTPELVNIIINEAGDRTDQLPLMQHALMRTWKNAVADTKFNKSSLVLTVLNYSDAGRIKDALNRDADAAWANIKDDARLSEICRKMFMLLCDTLPSGQIVRRRPRLSELIEVTGASESQIKKILTLFQEDDRNFLLPSSDIPFYNDTILDITHEALFRQWHEIQRWIHRESESVANYQELLRGAKIRQDQKNSQKAKDQKHPTNQDDAKNQPSEEEYRLTRLDTERLALWRKTEEPTEAWASRYGGDLKNAIVFLESCQSSYATDADRQRRHRKYQLFAILALLLVVAIALSIFASILNENNRQLSETVQQQQKELSLQKERSQLLQKDAQSIEGTQDPRAHFKALRLAARSLRAYQGNRASQILLCRLMFEHRWCLPATPTIENDAVADKYFLAATLSNNKRNLVVVTQEATLLTWDGHAVIRRGLSMEGAEGQDLAATVQASVNSASKDQTNQVNVISVQPSSSVAKQQIKTGEEGITPLPKIAEAFFSDDARYLIITVAPSVLAKAPLAPKNQTTALLYIDDVGNGSYRPLTSLSLHGAASQPHSIRWSPGNTALIVSTIDWQKSGTGDSQLFEREGGELKPTDAFDGLQISSACFSSDGKYLFTCIPAITTSSVGGVSRPAKILRWSVSYEASKLKILPEGEAFDLPQDYQKPYAISSNADGSYLGVTAWNSPALVVDTNQHAVKQFYLPDGSPIVRVTFCPSIKPDISDLMLVATNDRIGFWRATQLKYTDQATFQLGEPWCEPIVFQGMPNATFSDNGAAVVMLSGGSYRSFEFARALQLPINEPVADCSECEFRVDDSAPSWLLDLAAMLTSSGRESESGTEDQPSSVGETYRQHRETDKGYAAIYEALWEKFLPTDSELVGSSTN